MDKGRGGGATRPAAATTTKDNIIIVPFTATYHGTHAPLLFTEAIWMEGEGRLRVGVRWLEDRR